jgi:DNA-directed RNA polymerase specialized sigma24 family protein
VDQVAAAMDCPSGTVKTLVFRAREALRLRLAAWEGTNLTQGGRR